MPHAILECSQNIVALVEKSDVLAKVHQVLIDCGLFNVADIKTRAYPAGPSLMGTQGAAGQFLHVWVYLLEGRTHEQKTALSQAVFETLAQALPSVHSLSVDIRELARSTYSKRLIN